MTYSNKLNLILIVFVFFFSIDAYAISIDLGEEVSGGTASNMIQIVGLITILSLAPAIIMMITSFTKVAIVLSFLRTAIGLQQTPPNIVIMSLSLFLTFFIMAPTLDKAYVDGIKPMIEEKIDEVTAIEKAFEPFRTFMKRYTREKDLILFTNIAKKEIKSTDNIPSNILIPAFMISELKRAFEMGFLIFLPFLIIDMLVASILMALGMMMLPPIMISLPFKIVFFVLIDVWHMLCGNLVKSYGG